MAWLRAGSVLGLAVAVNSMVVGAMTGVAFTTSSGVVVSPNSPQEANAAVNSADKRDKRIDVFIFNSFLFFSAREDFSKRV
jgi:hypothetical protein